MQMGKLWEKDYKLNKLIEAFTVGEDYLLDKKLLTADCTASTAHAVMLNSIGILTDKELKELKTGLNNIIRLHYKGEFSITIAEEDCHTAIENYLIKETGEAGKKIHTGRSRNDQVLVALRLYTKAFLHDFFTTTLKFTSGLLDFAAENRHMPMPGRTHMQIAMPSSVGLWSAAYAEEILDVLYIIKSLYGLNDMCPLGSAASYGVSLPLDRKLTSDLLGFKRVQNNVLYAGNSRGKVESMVLDGLEQVMLTLSKIAQDVILFSLPEFGYFSLPDDLCSGSSIMPQKKNPDSLEAIRAKSAVLSGYSSQIKSMIRSLPSGYNRDFQETKEPFLKGLELSHLSVSVMSLTINKLKVNKENLVKAFTPPIFATDEAYRLVKKGIPFRKAYKQVGLNLDKLKEKDPLKSIDEKKYPGTTGNLDLEQARKRTRELQDFIEAEKEVFNGKIEKLMNGPVKIYNGV